MFINAKPRMVSNSFETFVPSQRVESLHQRLVEMTNNDVNAWSIFRPVAPSATDDWDQPINDFNSNENFSVRSLCISSGVERTDQHVYSNFIRWILPRRIICCTNPACQFTKGCFLYDRTTNSVP